MTERGRIGVDTSGAIVEVDATFCHTLNATAAILLGSNMLDFTAPADRERCRRLMRRVVHTGSPISTTKRLVRTDSSHLWVQGHLSIAPPGTEVCVTMIFEETMPGSGEVKPEALLKTAQLTLDARRARGAIFCPSLFADSAWDILLAAYVSEAEGVLLTPTDLEPMLGVGHATLTRWIRALEVQGLIEFEAAGDGRAGGAAFQLTCDAHQRFERYLSDRYAVAVSAATDLERFR
ncbi:MULTISPECIES: PAS domain-containing protein [Sphingomonas]|jgi:PAS domain S-box-containing protein|uniref:PAS domain-containing protein n=1 Tax=Sphingomonas TaxID=13687 RepID=UPI0009DF5147|nr:MULTISPECIES: PAS domain-containing protein [unclassified Sphingomonas]MBD8471275.1 PAS domain-containing protein [Sphingomonas sp. CFBP 8765]MBD8733846.1 PAS domain-containing protein [Sphingomonas sp. CFBP 13706]MDY1007059.1 PAS domain-containing protein [Sphingomonas sp. CFBP9019]